ncbi:LamG-like jellyroll fold domain-containing protein [Synoicihabitans lomoniglobus]|uniref:LamG-like jellyroll fold domain-containing protein n=1 Tax=Synoicihabitans lomoniglobus TaxID=2909285 RepID=A0AAF0CMF9_9BACT|nr:hypothetical protein [Opitutaceae bacterium LMO-M01]WED64053.1 hypothetical protein PXH66_17075 [Opitutaceae bacterium LMO-M01]
MTSTSPWFFGRTIIVVSAFFAASLSSFASNPNNTLVGAIRWDVWNSGASGSVGQQVEATLGPKHWHYRLPFFAEINGENTVTIKGDTAAVFERELAYAEGGGIDYFAYLLYRHSYALGKMVDVHNVTSSNVDFCAIIQGDRSPAFWTETNGFSERMLDYFQNSDYQTVNIGGVERPLVYIFLASQMQSLWGSWAAAKAELDLLASDSITQGTGDPYFVALEFSASSASSAKSNLGLDAVSSYATSTGSTSGAEYSILQNNEKSKWNSYRTSGGGKVIPWVTTGWDRRTRFEIPQSWANPPPSSFLYYTEMATPSQVADQLQDAINWVDTYSSAAEANTVLVYAWDEFDEGGWICPTLEEGPDRLNAIATVLGAPGITTGVGKEWSFTSNAESWTGAYQVSGFTHDSADPGTIDGSPAGIDPQVYSADNLGESINEHHIVAVRMKNGTAGTKGHIYFLNPADSTYGFTGAKSHVFSINPNDAEYREYTVNFADNSNWIGPLRRLRIDPENGASSGSFSIDYVRIMDTIEPAPFYTGYPMIGAWLLDGTSSSLRATDSASKGHVGYINGDVSWSSGKVGSAAVFDGAGDYITVHDSKDLDGMAKLTIAAWVWVETNTAAVSVPVGKASEGGSYRLTVGPTGYASLVVATSNNAWYSTGTSLGFGTLSTGQWYHLVGTYDGSKLRTYLNGSLVNTATTTISGSIAATSSPLHFGYKSADNIDWFAGKIDEVIICDQALNSQQVADLYNAPQ